MSAHRYSTVDVPVEGGALHVGVWDPVEPAAGSPAVLLVHGVTSSHLAWPLVVESLPGVRVIAPDLRGRGRSNTLTGPAGLGAHADDLAAVLTSLGVDSILVAGHSMGAFVSVVFAHRHPDRVSRLVLIDGGLPLDAPAGLDTDQLIAAILGPTAARLSMRFPDTAAYFDLWRAHPAFADAWGPELEEYLEYDLVDDGEGGLRPATSYQVVAEDTADMTAGTSIPDALAGLAHPTAMITVPRGLQDEEPGLYAPAHLARMLERYPDIRHERVDGFNHYTIVLSHDGGRVVAELVAAELAAASA